MLPLLLAALLAASDSTVYPVLNHDRVAGSMIVMRNGDTVSVRYVFTDRNRGTRTFARYISRHGAIVSTEILPVLDDDRIGSPFARLEISSDSVRSMSGTRVNVAAIKPGVYYGIGGTPYDQLLLVRHLLKQRNYTVRMPGGDSARLEVLQTLTVNTGRGREPVRLVAVHRAFSRAPSLLWIDRNNDLFATEVAWFMTVRPGAEPALPALRKAETAYRDREGEALNARVQKKTSDVVAIRNGNLFDSEHGAMRPNTTVILKGDRIIAVGPTESTPVPANATVVDASGKTIMPGMWDMHGHMQLTSENTSSPLQLAYGITTVRDLASDIDVAVSQRDRSQAGKLAAPRAVLAGFMEGPLQWAGPTSVLVSTEAEAREWVARYDSLGYKQIKVYNVVHPDLIPVIAAEAHKRGMRLSGHIPRGLSVPAAVQLGFDEVNHAAFLFSTFYQDSLYVPKMRAYSAVASIVAPNIDVDGAPMTDLIRFLKQHDTVIDGTFAVWVQSAGTGIAQQVGAPQTGDIAKADANYTRLIKRLYDAGVTLVPGTDNFGSTTFDTELELYEKAGIPAPVVLQIATIVPARVMKDEKEYGSVAVGKVADLFIVNSNPAEHVSDIRKVEQVVRAGRLYDATSLREATGIQIR